ncbi:MAG: MFS transporter [Deltaproteobacteria bacterium]|nr:MAG: MFS transporter [Deltaproteobacteria bacterium]
MPACPIPPARSIRFDLKLFQKSGAFRALSYPDYFWFWSSYFVSNVGSWMQGIAQGWLLFELTSSPFYLGLFSSLRMVMLLSFFILGGIMSDRIDRRKVMLAIQWISALTALGLAVLVSTHAIRVWHIFVLGAITSTTWAFEQPVRQALLPQLVKREDLVNALALNALTWNGAGLLGPSLVGMSVPYIGIDGCFYVNVVSYLAVIGALLRMNVPALNHAEGRSSVLQSLRDAFGYVRGERIIMTFLSVSAIFNIFGRSYITLLPVFAKDVLRLGASGFGFISAGPGLGTIIGSLTLATLGRVEAKRSRMVTILIAFSACLFAFALSGDAGLAFGFLVAVGTLSTVFETLMNTSIQLRVEEAFRGRVSGFYGLTGGGLREFGGMQAGFVAEWTSAPIAISAGAVVLAIVGYMFLGSRLRNLAE